MNLKLALQFRICSARLTCNFIQQIITSNHPKLKSCRFLVRYLKMACLLLSLLWRKSLYVQKNGGSQWTGIILRLRIYVCPLSPVLMILMTPFLTLMMPLQCNSELQTTLCGCDGGNSLNSITLQLKNELLVFCN